MCLAAERILKLVPHSLHRALLASPGLGPSRPNSTAVIWGALAMLSSSLQLCQSPDCTRNSLPHLCVRCMCATRFCQVSWWRLHWAQGGTLGAAMVREGGKELRGDCRQKGGLRPHTDQLEHLSQNGYGLYYTILYYTILYYTILYYTIPYYTILYYTIHSLTPSPFFRMQGPEPRDRPHPRPTRLAETSLAQIFRHII